MLALPHVHSLSQLQRTLYYLAIAMQILACLSAVFFRWMESTSLIAEAQSVWEMWVISFYWVLTCLSTVGFGDIFPLHDVTRIYSLVVMVFSIYMNVYLLSSGIAPALQKGVIQQKIDEKKAKLAAVLQFYKVCLGLPLQLPLLSVQCPLNVMGKGWKYVERVTPPPPKCSSDHNSLQFQNDPKTALKLCVCLVCRNMLLPWCKHQNNQNPFSVYFAPSQCSTPTTAPQGGAVVGESNVLK